MCCLLHRQTPSLLGDTERLRSCGALTVWFKARTASLCSHISVDAVNRTTRIATPRFVANSTHLLRTSASALVLSVDHQHRMLQYAVLFANKYVPTATDFPLSKNSSATLIHLSRFRTSARALGTLHESPTHCFQCILVDSFESEWLELFPVERTLPRPRAPTE